MTYRRAGTGSRLGAFCVDASMITLVITAATVKAEATITLLLIRIALFYIIGVLYSTLTERVFYGVTGGKALFGLKAVSARTEKFRRLSLWQAFLRNAVKYSVDIFVGILLLFSGSRTFADRAAKTAVVVKKGATAKPWTVNTETTEFIDKLKLGEDERELLSEFFLRKDSFIDKGAKAQGAIVTFIAAKFGVDEAKITQEVLKTIYLVNQ
ncbi:MAG: RDD family protein [Clostridiales bacterium]|nr:RDD family protein [Clostridiales bacterium]